MKIVITMIAMVIATTVAAQEANTLDALGQTLQKHKQALLEKYDKSLDILMVETKKNGNLDAYLVLEAEKKRFSEDKTVPLPDPKAAFFPSSDNYHKTHVDLLRKYISALDNLAKAELRANRIDNAKDVKIEKDKIAFILADAETKLLKESEKKAVVEVTKEIESELPPDAKKRVYLADIEEESAEVGYWSFKKGRIFQDGNPVAVNGARGEHYLLAHAYSKIVYNVADQGFLSIRGGAGINDGTLGSGEMKFNIYGDGKLLWESQPIRGVKKGKSTLAKFDIPIKNVKTLELEVDPLKDNQFDQAVWIDPTLVR